MKHLFAALPVILLSLYVTKGNIGGFRHSLMRPLSVAIFALMALALFARYRATGGLSAIEKSFLIYMAFNAVAFWGLPQNTASLVADFPTGLLYAIMFLVVAIPALFMKSYFTEFYARKSTPAAVQGTDIFKAINRHLTWVWAILFIISAFITAIPYLFDIQGGLLTGLFFQVFLPTALIVGVGLPLSKKYPEYYKHKMGIEPLEAAEACPAEASIIMSSSTANQDQKGELGHQLRVVAINGSPHGVIGNTNQMLRMIAGTLSREGIGLEEVSLADRNIEYCIGCAVCLEKGKCWRPDDYSEVVNKILAADGIILASPVYFGHVTAQMKTFIDRSLSYGHKPRRTWKPGLAISVSAGRGETETAHYLARSLGIYGTFSIGTFTAIATNPGTFLGKEHVEARAQDLGHDLARAIKEKRQYPATDEGLASYLFMKELVNREKDFMCDDYQYWQKTGLLEGFEAYTNQLFASSNYDPEFRKEWLKEIIQEDKAQRKGERSRDETGKTTQGSAQNIVSGKISAENCHELLRIMPQGFKSVVAQDLKAIYQFEITGKEEFTAHLKIENGQCTFHEGPYAKPDVVIKSPADVWLAISRGEMNGQTAFMSGKYKVEGNIGLIMKLKSLFG
jgi:multimeric flavodoxin WrbA/putative sterol carrier protein